MGQAQGSFTNRQVPKSVTQRFPNPTQRGGGYLARLDDGSIHGGDGRDGNGNSFEGRNNAPVAAARGHIAGHTGAFHSGGYEGNTQGGLSSLRANTLAPLNIGSGAGAGGEEKSNANSAAAGVGPRSLNNNLMTPSLGLGANNASTTSLGMGMAMGGSHGQVSNALSPRGGGESVAITLSRHRMVEAALCHSIER